MPKEVDPKDTRRAAAYELWMKAPNPMVTFFKTFDVTNLVRISRKNPFIIWGRCRKKWFRYYLPLSFQFHHTQMDGAHAGRFLAELQDEIRLLGHKGILPAADQSRCRSGIQ